MKKEYQIIMLYHDNALLQPFWKKCNPEKNGVHGYHQKIYFGGQSLDNEL